MPRPRTGGFNAAFGKGKRPPRQQERTWTTDPDTGLSDVQCGCGVKIGGYAGDPQEWADRHVCTYETLSTYGGIPR